VLFLKILQVETAVFEDFTVESAGSVEFAG